jgi:hypothetical protein
VGYSSQQCWAVPLEAAMAVIFVSSNIWIELRFPLEPY